MKATRMLILAATTLVLSGCAGTPLQGPGALHQPIGELRRLKLIAVSQGRHRQVQIACHDDVGGNLYYPPAYRINTIIELFDRMLATDLSGRGASYQVGEVAMPKRGAYGTPKMTFDTSIVDYPGAMQQYNVNCYDEFIIDTQHYHFTRDEADRLRGLLVEAREWLHAK